MTEPLTHAPDFPYDFEWVNTDRPLSLFDDLSGYVVLVHFWTSSCVHCHHSLATLAWLEQRFLDRSFMVIGVHAGKFHAERNRDHVLAAVRRLDVRHPVVIDQRGEIWKEYQCRAWPALRLVDSSGHVRFQGSGEPDRERMAGAIEFLLDEAAAAGDEPYSELMLEEHDGLTPLTGLASPGGIAVDAARGVLWIADTAHHRLVGVDPNTGETRLVVGTGMPGAADGGFAEACFFRPGALLMIDGALFVADAGNHLIRRVDFDEERVESVLGTGRPVVDYYGGSSGPEQPINSPWGLAHAGEDLFVAMAGAHQIWRVELATMTAGALVGGGAKGLADGPGLDASLAQPAGMAVHGGKLTFVDSDSSSLRSVELASGEVTTLVGGGVYKWGDRDGDDPSFQHPRAVAWHGDDLLIGDTFNDKIRRRRDGVVETLDVDALRPEAMTVDGDTLFVADTGNHRIVAVDLAAGTHAVLPITDLPPGRTAFATEYAVCTPVQLPPMDQATLRLPMDLPAGAVLQPGTSTAFEAENLEENPLLVEVSLAPDVADGWFMARGLATGEEGEGVIRIRLRYATCHEDGQVCHLHERRLDVPVEVLAGMDECADVVVAARSQA